jgi:DNA repair exonuclease SbcCD ATPase subunit
MKILSVRLHPFAASQDRTIQFRSGLNVIEAPNEFGKSTLSRALWNALFTPTNLTPGKLRDQMGRYYPSPGGDHAQVTVCFEVAGETWKLVKRWGINQSCELSSARTAPIADAKAVQDKILELSQLDLATWQKVLFINQAELGKTLEQLREDKSQIADVHAYLEGAAAIPGDISADRLDSELAQQEVDYYSRWDRLQNGPENGRGIGNPWKQGIGSLLQEYYNKERIREERNKVRKNEEELDQVNSILSKLQGEGNECNAFLGEYRPLLDGLKKRALLELQKKQSSDRLKTFMEIIKVWPSIDTNIMSRQEELDQIEVVLQKTTQEKKIAQQRQQLEHLKKSFDDICSKKREWEDSNKRLGSAKKIDEAQVKDLSALELGLRELQIKIDAQKLAAQLETKSPATVTVRRGDQPEERVSLTPEQAWQGEASGQIRIVTEDLTITIKNAQEDIDKLFETKRVKTELRDRRLHELGLPSLDEVQQACNKYLSIAKDVETKKKIYESALQKESFENWQSRVAEFDALEQTRSVAVLDEEITRLSVSRNEKQNAIKGDRDNLERWKREYTSVDNLMSKVLDERASLLRSDNELSVLPSLPENFTSIEEFESKVRESDEHLKAITAKLQDARVRKAALEALPFEKTAEELSNQLADAEQAFERVKQRAQSLERIRAKLREIVTQRGNIDPLRELREAIARQLEVLTVGRYREVKLEGTVPSSIVGEKELASSLLSQGTLGSLALATRLALAELYRKQQDGFLLLDDPMTDMDPQRRDAAAKALNSFAGSCQVLLFTCHPEHRQQLESHGAFSVTVSS